MASENFATALNAVLRHEGGYVDHPADPGGATNLGITRATLTRWRGRAVSKAEVKALSKDEAARIYRALYWDSIGGDDLPAGVDFAVFDYCVNSGTKRAAQTLQKTVGAKADGWVGKSTIAATKAHDPATVIRLYCKRRMSFLEGLRTWKVFGRGWKRRVNETEELALQMAAK